MKNKNICLLILVSIFFVSVLSENAWGKEKINSIKPSFPVYGLEQDVAPPLATFEVLTNISREGHVSSMPKKFKSEEGSQIFSLLGAAVGVAGYFGAVNGGLDPITALPVGVFYVVVGAWAGNVPDSIVSYFQFNYFNVGFIDSKSTDNKNGVVSKEKIIEILEDVDVCETPGGGKSIGIIERGDFRRVIESRKTDGDIWY
jgi:hypothetical protein